MFSKELMEFMYGNQAKKEDRVEKEIQKKEDYVTKPISYLILKCSPVR